MEARAQARRRFAEAVSAADVAAFCIAAHAHPGLDVDAWTGRLDELAAGCPAPTFDALRAHLFDDRGFTGNRDDYGDPENSFLDSVLERRTGIPITLAVVTIEVGRRLGVAVDGVGMPGHFLVQPAGEAGAWYDPFNGGARYDAEGCRALFAQVHGSARGFSPAHLTAVPKRAIVARMLANLERGRLARDPLQLAWMCELHLLVPGLGEAERRGLGGMLRTVRARWN
jgi:regulator of sirC expression with transglutaminase-like and TPR domain